MSNMSVRNTPAVQLPEYNVAGFKPGDAIGAGVVVDPRQTETFGKDDVKMVTIDFNGDGQRQMNEKLQVMVKLPPEGFVPQDWSGPATRESNMSSELFWGSALGGVVGGVGGLFAAAGAGSAAEAGVLGAKLATKVGTNRVFTGVLVTGIVAGAVIGARIATADERVEKNNDAAKARRASVPDMIPPKQILNIPIYDK